MRSDLFPVKKVFFCPKNHKQMHPKFDIQFFISNMILCLNFENITRFLGEAHWFTGWPYYQESD